VRWSIGWVHGTLVSSEAASGSPKDPEMWAYHSRIHMQKKKMNGVLEAHELPP